VAHGVHIAVRMPHHEWSRDNSSSQLSAGQLQSTESQVWSPHRIGPRFAWLDHGHILIVDGRLSERRFEVVTDIQADNAVVRLREDGNFAGMISVERSPSSKGVTLANSAVGLRYRRGGLAAIMTWCAFRELLAMQESATFRIRMARSVNPHANDTEINSIGVGVIAARLGFRPALATEGLIEKDNIVAVMPLPGGRGNPPSVRISLRSYPFILNAFALSEDTMRPLLDVGHYQQAVRDVHQIRTWLRQGLLLIGEDYSLGQSGIERFVNALATDEDEAAEFRSKILPL